MQTEPRISRKCLLHLAPEKCISDYLTTLDLNYIPSDANPANFPHLSCFKIILPDGLSIFPDGYFDFIIHNHVLEHIPGDYRLHILEMLRILKSGGRMIFTIPLNPKAITIQGGEKCGPEMRIKLFGQSDHLKAFGSDLLELFRSLRGNIENFTPAETLSNEIATPESVYIFAKD